MVSLTDLFCKPHLCHIDFDNLQKEIHVVIQNMRQFFYSILFFRQYSPFFNCSIQRQKLIKIMLACLGIQYKNLSFFGNMAFSTLSTPIGGIKCPPDGSDRVIIDFFMPYWCWKLLYLENPFEFIWNLKSSFEIWKLNLNLKKFHLLWKFISNMDF